VNLQGSTLEDLIIAWGEVCAERLWQRDQGFGSAVITAERDYREVAEALKALGFNVGEP
jgi:hypothetical protein